MFQFVVWVCPRDILDSGLTPSSVLSHGDRHRYVLQTEVPLAGCLAVQSLILVVLQPLQAVNHNVLNVLVSVRAVVALKYFLA